MGTQIDSKILIACGECSNRLEDSFEQLRESAALLCPVCGHDMKRERAAVLEHIETIRKAIAEVGR